MFMLPENRSKHWYGISVFLFFLFLCTLAGSRLLLDISMDFKQWIAFAVISFILASIIGAGGFFGKAAFTIVSFTFAIIGMINVFFISMTRAHEGWSDITSVISFLVISAFGIVVGVIAEVIRKLFKKKTM
ncbi:MULTISPECIES: hypothetical protein [Anoxybacillus]|uniref:Permease n=1 Tax=Anoxybacillus flavithermus AK1 TaxID=1297581 RepID=M8CTG5_9BACL|nr:MULTISPECIES: hypothetical protein [Anoxybacillus]EMT44823.1 permease [Anoxybacillus flavithermus AK1]MBW7651969.1 permease [Anoxybacillus sp. ST4]